MRRPLALLIHLSLLTYLTVGDVGDIAVRRVLPDSARYPEGAPDNPHIRQANNPSTG